MKVCQPHDGSFTSSKCFRAERLIELVRRFRLKIAFGFFIATLGLRVAWAAETDLSVAWIQRLPKISYVWNSTNPAIEGWPKPGQTVTWVANVRSLGTKNLPVVAFRWLLDGKVVSSGSIKIPPRSVTQFRFPWQWERKRHQLVFEIDPSDSIHEVEERNNRLSIDTDALALGFWVEKKFWSGIGGIIARAGIGCTTFDDWMQRRVRQFNEMAALARYPETPRGVLDRWRIDDIHVVPDGALPVRPVGSEVRTWGTDQKNYAILYPDSKDRSIDMEWGFPSWTLPWHAGDDAWTLMYDSLVHELGHARYLIDVYSWKVSLNEDSIGISPPPPSTSQGAFHFTPENGLMNDSWGYIDRYSAVALNRIAGHRAIMGNYNEPSNIGSFLNDLPESNRIRIVTPEGKTFPNRKVRIYQASAVPDPEWQTHPFRLDIDGRADLEFTTDSQGAINVGSNPFSVDPLVLTVDRINTVAIVELIDNGASHWGYLESREFNLAYWSGKRDSAEYDLVVDAPICGSPGLGPVNVTPVHEALVATSNVVFQWPADLTAGDVQLWYAVDLGKLQHRNVHIGAGSEASITIHINGKRVAWWLVYKNPYSPPECPSVRSSTYFFDIAATSGAD